MKILLLGEYSGYHTALAEGLRELGHIVITASSGDGFKKYKSDIKIHSLGARWNELSFAKKIFKRGTVIIKNLKELGNFKNYDVVQIINPFIYGILPIGFIYPNLIKRYNKKMVLMAAGNDHVYFQKLRDFEYSPFDHLKDAKRKKMNFYNIRYCCVSKRVLKYTDLIIPMAYDYDIAYRDSEYKAKVHSHMISIPINVSKIRYKENLVKDKIIIFHGLSREEEKGTPVIREAFKIIEAKYPDKVRIVMEGRMPFNEYLKLLETVNIVVDQCRAYSYGVNATIAMAMGKVVMAGCSDKVKKYMNIPDCPIVDIKPDVNFIVDQLSYVIENVDLLECGKKGREFVEKHNDYVKIAQKFIQAWR